MVLGTDSLGAGSVTIAFTCHSICLTNSHLVKILKGNTDRHQAQKRTLGTLKVPKRGGEDGEQEVCRQHPGNLDLTVGALEAH